MSYGNKVLTSKELTRPADTTGYTAGDQVCGVFTFTDVPPGGFVVGAKLTADQKSIVPAFRVHLHKASPTLPGDNVALTQLYTQDADCIASFDLPAMATPAGTSGSTLSRTSDFTLRVPVEASGASFYAVLETLTAFTPASAGKFTLTLSVEGD